MISKGIGVGIDLSKFIYDKDIILFLSEQLQKDPVELTNTLIGKSSGYKEISRNVNFEVKERLQNKRIKGIYFRENLRRSYPERDITSHVVGLTDIDRQGIQGTELVFQNELIGEKGQF